MFPIVCKPKFVPSFKPTSDFMFVVHDQNYDNLLQFKTHIFFRINKTND